MTHKIASKQKQVYVLDYTTWRSGVNSSRRLGDGPTKLLNDDGYSCCLGQFAQQKGIKNKDLLQLIEPEQLANALSTGYDKNFIRLVDTEEGEFFFNTELTQWLINANDSPTLTPAKKLFKIRRLLHDAGCRLVIKNMPYEVAKELVQLYKSKEGLSL